MSIKKISLIIVLVLIINIGSSANSYASEVNNQYIRIGITTPLKNKNSVKLSSNNGFALGTWNNGFNEMFSINSNSVLVRTDDYYLTENGEYKYATQQSSANYGPYHIEVSEEFSTYNDAVTKVKELESKGIYAFPAFNDGFKVWIGQFINEEALNSELNNLTNKLQERLNSILSNNKRIIVQNDKGDILIAFDNDKGITLKALDASGNIGLLQVEKNSYRDYITFNRIDSELITINLVTVNNYLYGVVPREMSAIWELEALKAQAIAARNFTLINIGRHNSLGYDLCDTTHCQVYGGYNWENIRSNQAVNETSTAVLKYESKLVNAYYHSSSGGHTEDSENIWTAKVPYLRGVEDDFSLGSPNDTWKLVLTKDEIQQKLLANGINVGEVISIEPITISQNGRVLELMIRGTNKTEILAKEKSRIIFGTSSLKSTWFRVESDASVYVMSGTSKEPFKTALDDLTVISAQGVQIANRSTVSRINVSNGVNETSIATTPNMYIFDGRGWGHGLGMSQWGAKKMAELGYNYQEILEYYYTGAKVE